MLLRYQIQQFFKFVALQEEKNLTYDEIFLNTNILEREKEHDILSLQDYRFAGLHN